MLWLILTPRIQPCPHGKKKKTKDTLSSKLICNYCASDQGCTKQTRPKRNQNLTHVESIRVKCTGRFIRD